MRHRLKQIRKMLKLSQDEFASRLGISGHAISKYENGAREVTERVLNDICRVYRINKEWLLEGTGEMNIKEEISPIEQLTEQYDLNENERVLLETFLSLSHEGRLALNQFVENLVAKKLRSLADQMILEDIEKSIVPLSFSESSKDI